MSQMNRGEALRCIQIAKKCIAEGKLQKAEKFLNKSLRMYDNEEAKKLLASLSSSSSSPSETTTQNTKSDQQPTSPTLNRSSAASTSSSRMSKDEEVTMIRQILRAKNFYDILGIPKGCSDEKAMKKAYRKKALKCHPDRNKAPGAEEAFKKLSKAYDCLRDKRQRQIYDQYGEDSPQMRRNGHSAQFQQMTPDDIIRMFFGGDFGGGHRGGFHFHTQGFPQQRRRRGAQGEGDGDIGGPMVYIMQLMPIILVFFTMILPSLMMFGGNQSSSGGLFGGSRGAGSMENVYFSLEKAVPFTLEKRTSLDTVYYVQPSRRGSWGNQRYKSPKMEQEVENAYLNKLISECHIANERKEEKLKKIKSNTIRTKQRQKLLKKLMKSRRTNAQCNKLYEYVDSL